MRSNNIVKIISIIVIILSLLIIGVIFYQQRTTIVSNTVQLGKNIINYFPLGSATKQPSWNNTGSTTNSTPVAGGDPALEQKVQFEKIAEKPVASASVLNLPGASSTLVFIEKETGNIFQIKNGGQAERISNLTIPEVFDAYFGIDKSKNIRVVVRSVVNDQLQSIILNLNNNTAFSTSSDPSLRITKRVLPVAIKSITLSPQKDQLLLVEEVGSRAIIYTTDFDLKNKKIIKVLPFTDWLVSWVSSDVVAFQTRASSDVPGSVYYLNLKDASFRRVGANILGLTTLINPDAKSIIYSTSFGQSFSLVVRNFTTNKASNYTPKTLPEKCLWLSNNTAFICAVPNNLPSANYPDDWYQGNISFSDSIWLYYSENGQSIQIYNPEKENINLDLVPQGRDEFENCYFIDKNTSQLYRLNGQNVFDPGT
ncbi:MAG: hypothetical protein WCW56_02010 [Candidatus Paceibacterota bacterium]|jgi:hypothetical protein